MTTVNFSKRKQRIIEILSKAVQGGRRALSEYESKQIVASADVPITRESLAQSREDAVSQASRIGFPVVLKGSDPALTHKTEMDMVRVNLKNEQDVARAYDELMNKGIRMEGILVQEMVKGNREFVIGLTRDPQFGPCVMFGIGGIFTEALKDVSFRVAPLTDEDAREMIHEIKAVKLLDDFRGERAVDEDVLVKALVGVGELGMTHDEIAEIDINPLIVKEGNPVAVDALVILETGRSGQAVHS